MYSTRPSLIYGFHALDAGIANKILNHEEKFKKSENEYDWLGAGIYFWENNLSRAWDYALDCKKRSSSSVETPFVLGAVIHLGNCLDLLEHKWLNELKEVYSYLAPIFKAAKVELPKNECVNEDDFDFKKRNLDCLMVNALIDKYAKLGQPFDSVRGVFWEGDRLYPNAGFKAKNHIQITVINPNCIKGIFLPREMQEQVKSK